MPTLLFANQPIFKIRMILLYSNLTSFVYRKIGHNGIMENLKSRYDQ